MRALSSKFMLRLPDDLKAWIEARARRNANSQNSEIIRCVRDSMERQLSGDTSELSDSAPSASGAFPIFRPDKATLRVVLAPTGEAAPLGVIALNGAVIMTRGEMQISLCRQQVRDLHQLLALLDRTP